MWPSATSDSMSKPEAKVDDARLDAAIRRYLQLERVDQNRQHVEKLVEANKIEELETIIGRRLNFGTAGLRGSMGPGFGQMNELVVIQTSQGLASYLIASDKDRACQQGVVIGHDARHNSRRYAYLAALAFLQKAIPVHFCEHIVPTPLVAFGVKQLNCYAGIMITASHNPKHDNGYKVYGSNGAQILSPADKQIQEAILEESNQIPWEAAWLHELLESREMQSARPKQWSGLFRQVYGELSKSYFSYIETELVGKRRAQNASSNLCITYTSMHGVGHSFLARALDLAGFEDVFPVEAQKKPDPEFSTVRFPNPEESGALDLAFETARHANSSLILANDPDADRCGAALYEPTTGRQRPLSGNEIGTLLGWWAWECHTQGGLVDVEESCSDRRGAELARKMSTDCYMISTAVSSKFLASMAKREGFNFVETLTGFKYMGNLADELISKHRKRVLFAFEEAIGYMVSSSILDKDGIGAAVQLAQCAAYLAHRYNITLEQHLDRLYTDYGYHCSLNSYYTCKSPAKIREIFLKIQSNYPQHFSCSSGNFRVTRVRDLNSGYDNGEPDCRATLPTSANSFMVTFFVDDDITFTIRTSGTEPKIKYYSEIVSELPASNLSESQIEAFKDRARNRLTQLVQAAIKVCLDPDENDIEAAA